MKIHPPRFVYFDLGKVLLAFSHQRVCDQMASVSGVPVAQVRAFFGAEDRTDRLERGEITAAALYEEFCAKFDRRPAYEAMTIAGSDIFCLNTEIVPVVAQLTAANVRLGVLSNTCNPHWDFVAHGRYRILSDFFEVAALSFEIGAMKPNRRIYEVAADLAQVAPGDIFFTDDRPENVKAARDAGWFAVQYTSAPDLAMVLRQRGLRFNY